MKGYFVYILTSGRYDTLYVGVTNDLARRVAEHKSKDVPDFTAAIQREKTMKKWARAFKLNVIEEMNSQ